MIWPELVMLLSLLVHGCGGTFYEYVKEGRMDGAWDLSLAQSNVSVRTTKLSITQEKRFGPFSGATSDNATLTGTLDGDNIVITLSNADGTTTTLTGSASNFWNTFSGTYTSTGSGGSGTWSATREVATPTPTPTPAISVTPTEATLSCSLGQPAAFAVTGGTRASYSVTPLLNGSLVVISDGLLTTTGQFTVAADTACAGANGTVVALSVTDHITTPVTVQITITNP